MNILKRIGAISFFCSTLANAATFDFGYNSVFDPQASDYDLSVTGLSKYNEGGQYDTTYWGPSAANQMGTLIMCFTYPTATQSIFFNAKTDSYNLGYAQGQSFLYASPDGVNYTELISNPYSGNTVNELFYDGNLPAQLLGSTTLYIKVQLEETQTSDVAFGQLSRSANGNVGDIFEVTATTATPEPSSAALILFSLPVLLRRRR